MSQWVATGYGALDLMENAAAGEGYEIAVTSVHPGPPILLFGDGAKVWRALASGGVPAPDAEEGGLDILHDLRDMGLAGEDPTHPTRLTGVSRPWLTSFTHELVYALLQNVASKAGIELVFIKGPTLHAQGLREREHSGDVDCWVSPGDDVRLADAMRPWGWTPLMLPFTGTTITHSLTLVPGEWGCAVDVHTSFPGMRSRPADAFRSLLEDSQPRSFAGVRALTPSREAHAVLSALHDVRPYNGVAPTDHDIAKAATVLHKAGSGVMTVVDRFDAGYVLRAPLARAFGDDAAHRYSSALPPADWAMRTEAASSIRHFKALKFVPMRHRLRALTRLVWPTTETMRISMGNAQAGRRAILVARVRRVGQSIKKLATGR
ncbi:nucleotidyltransferase family protein [Microbacterium sp. TPD7012]|uniref:nucleotidyltransferase family protein n=1 Tax=Microbacterium sp. TPD7012 TaxID=2171975 RepID=UPI000D507EA5|nr:nucleotidyltransferase family protein [Microbacterium sp. TPD7012]PVE97113.1 hypothetical protein DC434_06950 [Microbacterium sp. TPD7012]